MAGGLPSQTLPIALAGAEPPPMFPDDQGNLVYQQPRWTGSPMTGGSTRFNEAPASLYKPTSTHSNVAPINQSEQP
jgi:hypothetical protein